MKRIWISDFLNNKSQVKGFSTVTILVPYGQDYEGLKQDMINLGFSYTSTRFAGPDLMDTEQSFRKI